MPYNPLKVNQQSKQSSGWHMLSHRFCSAYSSTMKMEATCSSEMLVDFQQTTCRYIPEDSTLHNHHCENLKSYIVSVVLLLIQQIISSMGMSRSIPFPPDFLGLS
jgi:hypothetical protein